MSPITKTVVIDARCVTQKGHGIAEYILGFVETWAQPNNSVQQYLRETLGSDFEPHFLISPLLPSDSPIRRYAHTTLKSPQFGTKEWFEVPKALKRLKPDLFFNPTFSSYPTLPVPYIQTVHDLNHLHFGGLAQKLYYQLLLKNSIQRATRVFTVSEFSKKELVEWTHMAAAHFLVTLNQIAAPIQHSPAVTQQVLQEYGLKSKRYFLSVSGRKPHKNLDFLLTAYTEAKQKNPSIGPLVVTADPKSTDPEGVLAISAVNKTQLDVLYREAAAALYPSVYEGFGRPPIEAALAGTPSYASDIEPHREGARIFSLPVKLLPLNDPNAWTSVFLDAKIGPC
jgi:glycosyltransferase involved in cell wall biosynthesis